MSVTTGPGRAWRTRRGNRFVSHCVQVELSQPSSQVYSNRPHQSPLSDEGLEVRQISILAGGGCGAASIWNDATMADKKLLVTSKLEA